MSRIVDPVPHYESVSRIIEERKVVTSSDAADLGAAQRRLALAFIEAVCMPWFRRENIPTQTTAQQVPICTTRL
jgi:hypothetical protein